jgi:hypothetical protein
MDGNNDAGETHRVTGHARILENLSKNSWEAPNLGLSAAGAAGQLGASPARAGAGISLWATNQ